MGGFTQIGILFWKNWLLQKRKVWLTVFEIGLPTVFALVLVFIRQRVHVTDYPTPRTWPAFGLDEWPLPPPTRPPYLPWQVAFTPNNQLATNLMKNAKARLNLATNG